MNLTLRPYQREGVQSLRERFRRGDRNVLYQLPTGGGKCLGRGTPVLMFSGMVSPVELIKPGQRLMGPDSKPRTVVSVCQGREMLYRITPTKGDPYIVNESHILSLKRTKEKNIPLYPCHNKQGEIVNLTVKEYLSKSKYFKHLHKGWRVPVKFVKKRQSKRLPPYLLGLWLGDGTARTTGITNVDPEIIDYLSNFAISQGLQLKAYKQDNKTTIYNIVPKGSKCGRGGNVVRKALIKYRLLRNKHIPFYYLTGSYEQRLELLAGLIDSDGHLIHNSYDFINKIEDLTDDVVFLARSCGLAAYKTKCTKGCNGKYDTYFRCNISGDTDKIPCRVERKKASPRLQKKDVLVTGISVEPIGEGDYFGFEISGPDRLFLLGDFTVTHNTILFSEIVREHQGTACVIAHRKELVCQMSLALARAEVMHRVIGPDHLVKLINRIHTEELGRSFYHPSAQVAVASVQTLRSPKRREHLAQWCRGVTLWVQDETHHLTRSTVWGDAVEMFPNAKGLGVTATPSRMDGQGLGRHADGYIDIMVEGPRQRELIKIGYLSDYKIFAPPPSIDIAKINVGKDGDFTQPSLKREARKSKIVGDVVQHYFRFVPNMLTVVFSTDVETAHDQAKQFVAAGVPAAALSAETPDEERFQTLRRFRNRDILVLVNVALFDEGFDLPAMEAMIDASPTMSFGKFIQRCGRVLRISFRQ